MQVVVTPSYKKKTSVYYVAFSIGVYFALTFSVFTIFKYASGQKWYLYEFYAIISIVTANIVGVCFFIYGCIKDARELTVTEEGIKIRNTVTKKERFIKYGEIQKVKRQRTVVHHRYAARCYLEIELKKGKFIVFEDDELIDIAEAYNCIHSIWCNVKNKT
jgi:hypothetical protein